MEIITFSAQTAMRFKSNKHVSQCYTIVYLVLCGADYTTLRTPFVFTHPVLNIPIITDSIPGGYIIMLQQPDTPPEVVLNCTVEAHPIPSLTWTRDDGRPVDQQQVMTETREMAFSSLLTVPSTQLAGRAEFTCTADVMGTTAQSSVAITAYCELLRIVLFIQYIFLLQSTVLASTSVSYPVSPTAPVTITDQPESPPPLMIGETVSLSCTASSIPIPGITWFQVQNGMNIQLSNESGDVTIVSEEQDETTLMSTLQLSLNNEMDFTEYFCHGDNNFTSTDSNAVQIEQACEPMLCLLMSSIPYTAG